MAKSFTLTCPKLVLERIIPDFDVMGKNPVWVKAKVKALLDSHLLEVDDTFQLSIRSPEDKIMGESVRMLISVGGSPELMLKSLASESQLTESEIARRVLCAIKIDPNIKASVQPEAALFVEILNNAGYTELRPEQISFYLQNKASLLEGKIGLSEAATGTGKTLSMLIGAAEVAVRSQSRVVIAVPTISLIYQFKEAYHLPLNKHSLSLSECIETALDKTVTLRSIFGRREFISEFSLRALIQSGELPEDQSLAANGWLTGLIQSNIKDPDAWLISALDEVVRPLGAFPMDEVRLPEIVVSTDLGFLAYKRQMIRVEVNDIEIVVVTHAMLGIDFRSRLFMGNKDEEYLALSAEINLAFQEFSASAKLIKTIESDKAHTQENLASSIHQKGKKRSELIDYEDARGRTLVRITEENGIIPAYRYLIIDECHQFESNLSLVLSSYVSLRSIGRDLKSLADSGVKVTKSSIKLVNLAMKEILSSGPKDNVESRNGDIVVINGNNNQDKNPELLPAIRTIVNVLEGVKAIDKNASIESKKIYLGLKTDLIVLRAVAKGAYGMLNFSPVRKFPQLTVGRPSIESFLRQLWSFVTGASCVSATIYLPKGDGITAWYLKSTLSIPAHREAEYSPSIGPWIYRPIQSVWQPETLTDIEILTPPSMKLANVDVDLFEASVKSWHQSVAIIIVNKILPVNQGGGILMLSTSYKTCEDIKNTLAIMAPKLKVVYARPEFPLSQQKAEFIKLRRENQLTLWLATGAAWTGLDVSGKDIGVLPENDNMITDLVIPRLPFNTNRSITHLHRKIYKPSISWEIFETCFAFRQALGRLIRRVGLPENRRLWILDGRIVSKDFARYAIFQKIIDRYKK